MNKLHILFVVAYPVDYLTSELRDLCGGDSELDANFDDVTKLAHVSVVFWVGESPLKEDWCQIKEPETPCLGSIVGWISAENANEVSWKMLHSICGLLSNDFPYGVRNLIGLRPRIKPFKLSTPELDEIGDGVLKEKMHTLPGSRSRVMEGANAS